MDLTKPIKINVLQKHIDKGIKSSSISCPIAKSIREVICSKKINVGYFNISIKIQNNWYQIRTPKKVYDFIDKFDNEKKVKPFSFVLKLKKL